MSEEQRYETVKEYLKRGGKITRFPDGPNSFYGVEFDSPSSTVKPTSEISVNHLEFKRVSWKDIEYDEKIIETDDQYWKAVDIAVNKLMSKFSRKKLDIQGNS